MLRCAHKPNACRSFITPRIRPIDWSMQPLCSLTAIENVLFGSRLQTAVSRSMSHLIY